MGGKKRAARKSGPFPLPGFSLLKALAVGHRRFHGMKTAIHWFRRDLRITDNTALRACAAKAEEVIPVYVVSDWQKEHRWTGPHRQEFLCGSLESLGANLKEIGAKLIIRQGAAVEELLKLAKETRAEAIYFNRDPDPFGRKTEELLRKEAVKQGVEVVDFKDVCIHERDEVLNGSGDPFRVFTPYSKAWEKVSRPGVTGKLPPLMSPQGIKSLEIPDLATWGLKKSGQIIEPGEKAARTRMKKFFDSGLARLRRPARSAWTRRHLAPLAGFAIWADLGAGGV